MLDASSLASLSHDCAPVLEAWGCQAEDTVDGRVLIKDGSGRALLTVSWSTPAEDLASILNYGDRMRSTGYAGGFRSGTDLLA